MNALHLAAKDGHLDIVRELLNRGAVVDAATKKGNTALHIASLGEQTSLILFSFYPFSRRPRVSLLIKCIRDKDASVILNKHLFLETYKPSRVAK